ncbi:hypothetical protein JHK87_027302 [Glycine soja]|nr:hypothetical protein JHK87_027302 [Glycine soja]
MLSDATSPIIQQLPINLPPPTVVQPPQTIKNLLLLGNHHHQHDHLLNNLHHHLKGDNDRKARSRDRKHRDGEFVVWWCLGKRWGSRGGNIIGGRCVASVLQHDGTGEGGGSNTQEWIFQGSASRSLLWELNSLIFPITVGDDIDEEITNTMTLSDELLPVGYECFSTSNTFGLPGHFRKRKQGPTSEVLNVTSKFERSEVGIDFSAKSYKGFIKKNAKDTEEVFDKEHIAFLLYWDEGVSERKEAQATKSEKEEMVATSERRRYAWGNLKRMMDGHMQKLKIE